MKRIFVDTSAWYALVDAKDPDHKAAKGFIEQNRFPLVTTNLILNEALTLIMVKLGQDFAVEFGVKLKQSQLTTIVFIGPEDEEDAWNIFRKYSDKKWSFTDCSSFVIMQRLKIDTAFAFDPHFKQMGFSLLP